MTSSRRASRRRTANCDAFLDARRGGSPAGVQHVFSQASFLSVTDSSGAPLVSGLDFVGTTETLGRDYAALRPVLCPPAF